MPTHAESLLLSLVYRCSGVIINDEWYHVFNVGDSRTVVCADGAMSFATRDHKPSDIGEFTRIQSAGGYVARGRINGQLAVSRALGDNNYKLKRGGHPRSQMVYFHSHHSLPALSVCSCSPYRHLDTSFFTGSRLVWFHDRYRVNQRARPLHGRPTTIS